MDRVICRKCQIQYRRRSIVAHQSTCLGGQEGFTPIHEKGRFVYRCHACGLTLRKQNTEKHRRRCQVKECTQNPLTDCIMTAPSASILKKNNESQLSCAIGQPDHQNSMRSPEEEKEPPGIPFLFEKAQQIKLAEFYCPVRKQIFTFDEEDFMIEEEEPLPPPTINQSVLQAEKIHSSLTTLTESQPISYTPKLKQFRKSRQATNPSLIQSIEIYALSCFLRLVGRFTREGRWELSHGLIQKASYWQFMVQAQPWIVNNKPFVNIVEEKLKYFVHDEENFIITNFDFVYQRLKGLIENYHIYPAKLERVFSRPVYERKGHPRMRRKNPDTLKMRIKLKKYRYKQGKGKKGKRPYGIRKLPQLAHQAIKYQVETIDQAFYMKQVFRKKPSQHHRAQVLRKRQRMMINFCMSTIADELTAAVILGQFKIWAKSIQSIHPDQRYLYVDQIPNIPTFQLWYPLTTDILNQWKWYYPHAYQRCSSNFESPLPQLTQREIFSKLCLWYRSRGLIIDHALYELQGFDQIRALLDSKYRIEQEKMRMRKKALTIEVNPRVMFPEDQDESSHELSVDEGIQFAADVPARGDPKKWAIVHQAEHLTGFNCCAACERPLKFPAPSCKTCLTAYHYSCLRELSHHCLCFALFDNSPEKMTQMLNEAIKEAKNHLKHVSLNVKNPPKANMMELKYQEENLQLNMEAMTRVGLWCLPGSITYHQSSKMMYLCDKDVAMLETFGKSTVFPGSIEEITGKGRGVIAARDVKKDEIVAIYPGKLVTQAQIIESYKSCKYIFNFQEGPTPFTSWAIVPVGVAHLGMFLNHGAAPNAIPTRFWSSKGPLLLFISLRKISMGEEILYDYGQEYHGHEGFI